MPTSLDDPIRPFDPPPPPNEEGIGDPGPLGPPADRFPRHSRFSVAEAVRQALRPRGTRGKTPFELGFRSR